MTTKRKSYAPPSRESVSKQYKQNPTQQTMEKEQHREAPGSHFQMAATSPMHSQEKGRIDLQPEHTRVEDISALTKVIQKAHTDT